VQAAIAALHARAANYEDTDWRQIAGLYEVLLRISPSPVIELNHAAAVSMVDGPARALDLIDALEARGRLKGYELLPAVRADLLRRLGGATRRGGVSGGDGSDAAGAVAKVLCAKDRGAGVRAAGGASAVIASVAKKSISPHASRDGLLRRFARNDG
jgi:hypothetical protein